MSPFSPFEEKNRPSRINDEPRPTDHSLIPTSEGAHADAPQGYESNNAGYAASKGSRFAKFFDGKSKEPAGPSPKNLVPGRVPSSSPNLPQHHEQGGYHGLMAGPPEHRAMDDIFAMLNGSAHVRY